jgi:alcohol dehydrogenase class IV
MTSAWKTVGTTIYGPGKIKELGAEAERRGLSRVLVVTTLGAFPILDQVTGALGSRCAARLLVEESRQGFAVAPRRRLRRKAEA